MTAPSADVAACVLLYLYADVLVRPAGSLNLYGTTAVPGTTLLAATDDLAIQALAASLWNVREQGYARLELEQIRLFFGTEERVRVERVRTDQPGGLEGALLAYVDPPGANNLVEAVLERWLGRPYANPYRHVVAAVQREAERAGLLRVRTTNTGGKMLDFDVAAIAALRQAHADFPRRWRAFVTGEATLASALLQGCATALANRRDPTAPLAPDDAAWP